MMTSENPISIVEQLKNARQLEQTLIDNGLADQLVGQAARDAAYAAVDELYLKSPEDITTLVSRQEEAEAEVNKLSALKQQMLEVNLSTVEVDDRIAALSEKALGEDERLAVAYFVGRDVVRLAETQVTEVSDEDEADQDALEQEHQRRTINIKFDKDAEDKAVVIIGSRKVKLSGANEHQTDYSPERFAALSVMSELLPGEEIKITDLWNKMYTDVLGIEAEPEFNRHVMTQIRSFLTEFVYRRQAVFYHNGVRGLGSAYGVNPDLDYDLAMDGTDDEVRSFARQLHVKATIEAGLPKTAEDTPVEADAVSETPATPSQSLELDRIPVPDTIPNILELHTFLVKIQSTLPRVSQQINIDQSSMLTRLYEITEEMLDYIEERQPAEERQEMHKETLDMVRSEVTEKFIRITEDYDLLNELLGDEYDVILENVYGKDVAVKVIDLIETILDMDEAEKGLLRQIIRADGDMKITVDGGSFTRGMQVVDVDFVYDGIENDAVATPKPAAFHEHDIMGDTFAEEVELTEEEVIPVVSAPENVTSVDFLMVEEEAVNSLPPIAPATEAEAVQTPHSVVEAQQKMTSAKLIRQTVGQTISSMRDAGMSRESRLGTRQLEAIFGVSVSNVVNARENNLIAESKSEKDLGFEDIAMILIDGSADPNVRRIMSVPRLRKQLRKQIRRTVSSL